MNGSEIDTGDPKMFFNESGFSLNYINGVPVMEDGIENTSHISLSTQKWFLNVAARKASEVLFSSFETEAKKSITVNQLKLIESAAVRSFDWMITEGSAKSVSASISNVTGFGYKLTVSIISPTDEENVLIWGKNGTNWILQQQGE